MGYKGKTNAVVNARCPYFIREYKRTISCEGMVKGTENTMTFPNSALKDKHIIQCCMVYLNECPLAKALDDVYEKEEQ